MDPFGVQTNASVAKSVQRKHVFFEMDGNHYLTFYFAGSWLLGLLSLLW